MSMTLSRWTGRLGDHRDKILLSEGRSLPRLDEHMIGWVRAAPEGKMMNMNEPVCLLPDFA